MRQFSRSGGPLRTVLVTHYFPAHGGGIEIVAAELARRLADSGVFQISWFASDTDAAPQARAGLECVSVPATNVIERRLKFPYPLWSPSIVGRVWRSIRVADVVHVHDFPYCGSLMSFCIAKVQAKPVLLTQHVGFIPYKSVMLRLLQRLIIRTLGSLLLRHADCAVFVSDVVRQEFSQFVKFRREPQLVCNGVDRGVYSPVEYAERESLRAAAGLRRGVPAFLFVGRFVEKKGLPILRGLAQLFPRINWLFAGAGPLDPQNWALDNVSVFRGLRGRGLADLYRAADLLVLPSKGEGFPLVVQEAMACGTPCLISRETAAGMHGLLAHCFSESVVGSETLARWQAAIESLVSRMDQLRTMRGEVAEFAHAHWNWNTCASEYARLLSSLSAARNERAT